MDEKWIMEAFERAIPPGEFFLQYQPVIRLLDSRVYGAESLIRWRHPEHGLVPARSWLPQAAVSGVLTNVATTLLPQWARFAADSEGPVVSFNLSGQELNDDRQMAALMSFPERSARRLAVEVHQLQFCFEEAHTVTWWPWEDVPDLEAKLARIRSRGFALWVDDYGEGSSDERTLRHPLVDVVKLDRSLLEADPDVLEQLVEKIHAHGKLALIEAVENEAQCTSMKAARVDLVQGMFFAPPLEAEEFARYIAANG